MKKRGASDYLGEYILNHISKVQVQIHKTRGSIDEYSKVFLTWVEMDR